MNSFLKINKTQFSIGVFLFINFVFSIKYLERATSYFIPLSMLLVLFYLAIYYFRHSIIRFLTQWKYINYLLIFLFYTFFCFVFTKIPQETLNADRWSVISSFWDNYFAGEYVYYAKSHLDNYPGPMPLYYVLALPFYFIGEMGYLSLLSFLPLFVIFKREKIAEQTLLLYLVLIFTSIFYLWEIATRSNIFLNASLVLASILFINNQIERRAKYFILVCGVVIGLVLSTRNVFVIPFVVCFLYYIKSKKLTFIEILKIGLITVLTFSLTFVPFIVNHIDDFWVMNPFIIQSGVLMPTWLSFLAILLSFSSYFFVQNKMHVIFYSGVFLFITIFLHFIFHIHRSGFIYTLYENQADVSYFIFCLPFFMYYFLKYDQKNFIDSK